MTWTTGLVLEIATPDDAPALVDLHGRVAGRLTALHGEGHWSHRPTERGVLQAMRNANVYVARDPGVVATLRLTTKKPWAIDVAYFTNVAARRALYLVGMAVDPDRQGEGLGRRCLAAADAIARGWPADTIRLDAYDSAAGAGPFYAGCGYREVGHVVYRGVPLIYYERLLA